MYYYPEIDIDDKTLVILKVTPVNPEEVGRAFNPIEGTYITCRLEEIKSPYTERFIAADWQRFCDTEEQAIELGGRFLSQFQEQQRQARLRQQQGY